MRALLFVVRMFAGFFGAETSDATGVWDPNGGAYTDAGGMWDPDGHA